MTDKSKILVEEFTQAFAFEIAMDKEKPSVVAERHGLTREQWDFLREHPPFTEAVAAHHRAIQESGVTFELRAKIAAEDSISVVHEIAHSADVGENTRLAACQTLAKWGGLEKKPGDGAGNQTAPFVLQFVMPDAPPVDVTPDPEYADAPTITLPSYDDEEFVQ